MISEYPCPFQPGLQNRAPIQIPQRIGVTEETEDNLAAIFISQHQHHTLLGNQSALPLNGIMIPSLSRLNHDCTLQLLPFVQIPSRQPSGKLLPFGRIKSRIQNHRWSKPEPLGLSL